MPLIEIKDFNTLIYNKPFFDQTVKKKQDEYEKRIEMSRNNYYTTGSLLDVLQENYKKIMVRQCSLFLESRKKLF